MKSNSKPVLEPPSPMAEPLSREWAEEKYENFQKRVLLPNARAEDTEAASAPFDLFSAAVRMFVLPHYEDLKKQRDAMIARPHTDEEACKWAAEYAAKNKPENPEQKQMDPSYLEKATAEMTLLALRYMCMFCEYEAIGMAKKT